MCLVRAWCKRFVDRRITRLLSWRTFGELSGPYSRSSRRRGSHRSAGGVSFIETCAKSQVGQVSGNEEDRCVLIAQLWKKGNLALTIVLSRQTSRKDEKMSWSGQMSWSSRCRGFLHNIHQLPVRCPTPLGPTISITRDQIS